jgi:DNA ligase D-like protein (predicted 3'-phosphoesterase)
MAESGRFVIQKHAATRLHYDFRLEVDGVYRSWAIPKGPSLNPRHKRLAVHVGDHSLSWGDFEGVISAGYGAGTVIIWDRGEYRNRSERSGEPVTMSEALAGGHAVFELLGQKLRGGFALNRFQKGGKESWILVKLRDLEADWEGDVLAGRPESVESGRTIEEIGGRRRRG